MGRGLDDGKFSDESGLDYWTSENQVILLSAGNQRSSGLCLRYRQGSGWGEPNVLCWGVYPIPYTAFTQCEFSIFYEKSKSQT